MNRTALILAAHGSHGEPSTNALICDYADRLRRMGLFDEVTPAFHHGQPGFAAALDGLTANDVTVVPVMTSAGYFCRSVLPSELRKSARYARVSVRQSVPLGTHPRMAQIVVKRVRRLLEANKWDPDVATLAIVGHGTTKHRRSREATLALARAVEGADVCAEVLPAFLDEDPLVETIPARAMHRDIIVVPFLIGVGEHATSDIPRRLGLYYSDSDSSRMAERVAGRRIICDAPVGTDPGIIDILVELARPAVSTREENV